MKQTQLVKTIFINADPETVWQYLTNKDKLSEWFHPAASDLKANTDYQLLNDKGEKICWGKVTEYEAPKRLVYTFTHNPLKGVESIVVWELSPAHNGTKLLLTHSGFGAENTNTFDLLISHDKGWDDHFSRLREKAGAK